MTRYPTVGVAAVLVEDQRVLLVRRRYGARAGSWCIPCGRVEWGEHVRDAVLRELTEETGLTATVDAVYDVHSNFHDPDRQTVGIWFRVTRTGGELAAADDADAVDWFPLHALPEPLAFPTDRLVLERLRRELRQD